MLVAWRHKYVLHKCRGGGYSVYLRVTLMGRPPVDCATGVFVRDREAWDGERQRLTGRDAEAQAANKRLQRVEQAVLGLFDRYEYVDKAMPEISDLRADIAAALGRYDKTAIEHREAEDDIYTVMDEFRKRAGVQNSWSRATDKYFGVLRNHLSDYRQELRLSRLDEATMQGFVEHLTDRGYRNTYVSKLVALMRWFLRWAAEHGRYDGTLHETFRPRLKGSHFETKEVIYLTLNELKIIEEYQFEERQGSLAAVRDVFVFCCYTGLRFSDAAKLQQSDIVDGHINVVTKKTSDRLTIELNKHSQAVLDKYKDAEWLDGRALPAISNQKSNAYIKEVGRLCGIDEPIRIVYYSGAERHEELHAKWELLSTHCARRTFVVTALQLGIPAEVIIKWTGHSDYKAMKPYIKIVDDLKARNMARFDTI